jgi:hypothetical protein
MSAFNISHFTKEFDFFFFFFSISACENVVDVPYGSYTEITSQSSHIKWTETNHPTVQMNLLYASNQIIRFKTPILVNNLTCYKSKSKSQYDRQSVGQSVLVSGAHLGPATNVSPWDFLLDSCCLLFCTPSLTRGRACHLSVSVFCQYQSIVSHYVQKAFT